MQIDKITQAAAVNRFEKLYGNMSDLGLSDRDCAKLLRYKIIPRWVIKKSLSEAKELELVADEFKTILIKVMKLRRVL